MRFSFNRPVEQIIKSAGVNDDMLRYAASAARELMQDFVPYDTGKLLASAEESVQDGRGRVRYNTHYARFVYYGEHKIFCRENNPMAGAFWDRAMMQIHRDELAGRVEQFIKGVST